MGIMEDGHFNASRLVSWEGKLTSASFGDYVLAFCGNVKMHLKLLTAAFLVESDGPSLRLSPVPSRLPDPKFPQSRIPEICKREVRGENKAERRGFGVNGLDLQSFERRTAQFERRLQRTWNYSTLIEANSSYNPKIRPVDIKTNFGFETFLSPNCGPHQELKRQSSMKAVRCQSSRLEK